ncbi:MAG: VOC family protein [Nitrospinota bacterium]
MASLRHAAVCTQDIAETLEFYAKVFGLQVVKRLDHDEFEDVFLSDGTTSIAILRYKSQQGAKAWTVGPPIRMVGLDHLGFLVNEPEEIRERLKETGAPIQDIPERYKKLGLSVPFKTRDPNGVLIDVAPIWPGMDRERIDLETAALGQREREGSA